MPEHIRDPLWIRVLRNTIIVLLVTFSIAPLIWMISTSFKTLQEQSAYPPTLIPKTFTIMPYIEGWTSRPFDRYFFNTAYVSVLTTVLCVSVACLCAYGFSRYRLKGANALLTLLFAVQMFPTSVVIVPYFMGTHTLGLTNTYAALVIAYSSFSLPLCIWMMKSFIDGVPKELDEAARLDGCNPVQTFIQVIMPLTRPGLIASTIFTFLGAWKEYLFALTLANKPDRLMISVAMTSFIGEHSTSWNQMMAMGIISTVPIIIIFVSLQKYLVSGMISGAVKS